MAVSQLERNMCLQYTTLREGNETYLLMGVALGVVLGMYTRIKTSCS